MRFSHAHVVGALFGQHELYGPSRTLQCMRSMRVALCSQSCCLDVGACKVSHAVLMWVHCLASHAVLMWVLFKSVMLSTMWGAYSNAVMHP